jgi:hypothetical protein
MTAALTDKHGAQSSAAASATAPILCRFIEQNSSRQKAGKEYSSYLNFS